MNLYLDYFIYSLRRSLDGRFIPVFCFHDVFPEGFEKLLRFLKSENYETLTAYEYYGLVLERKKIRRKLLVLTFDDGRITSWLYAYPILKRFDTKAVFFITPRLIEERPETAGNLEVYWRGRKPLAEVESSERRFNYFSWKEAGIMNESGIIDFQSHGLNHKVVFSGDKIVDFQRPAGFGKLLHGHFGEAGTVFGAPIYEYSWECAADRVYIPVKVVGDACVRYARENGGAEFFKRPDWKGRLYRVAKNVKGLSGRKGSFVGNDAGKKKLGDELGAARLEIEQRLGGKCLYFAPPVHSCTDFVIDGAIRAGYKGIFDGRSAGFSGRIKGDFVLVRRYPFYFLTQGLK
ncbi:MAG: polysaccharide deacetylase family protein [Candidatus Omnitrophica bacterium]|nr:polysaccharide deacetylase family protein [Candidatus Omnitrophota bacterium]